MHLCKVDGLALLSSSLLCCLTTEQQMGFIDKWIAKIMKDFWQPGQVIGMMNELQTLVDANGVLALMMTSHCHWFFGGKGENHTTEISLVCSNENPGIKNNDDYIIQIMNKFKFIQTCICILVGMLKPHHPSNKLHNQALNTQEIVPDNLFCGDMDEFP
jgi:hypothetical protein